MKHFALAAAIAMMAGCHAGGPTAHPSGASGVRPLTATVGHLDGTKWLSHDAEIATSLGAGPLEVAVTEVGGDGDRVGGFVNIPADQCVLGYARGSQGI